MKVAGYILFHTIASIYRIFMLLYDEAGKPPEYFAPNSIQRVFALCNSIWLLRLFEFDQLRTLFLQAMAIIYGRVNILVPAKQSLFIDPNKNESLSC